MEKPYSFLHVEVITRMWLKGSLLYLALMSTLVATSVLLMTRLICEPFIISILLQDGNTALIWAARNNHTAIASMLLSVPGVKVNAQSNVSGPTMYSIDGILITILELLDRVDQRL